MNGDRAPHAIYVDFEVLKQLMMKRSTEEVSYNDVLRAMLGLNAAPRTTSSPQAAQASTSWVSKGVSFPEGTDFRANYKGQFHYAKVESGGLVLNGRRFSSPSAAAVAITNRPTNGWAFWECRTPGGTSLKTIDSLRP